jgi:stage V sporulation protein G
MRITEVRIKLAPHNHDRLHAFCSITIDDAIVVRDLKIVDGARGLFVAMPSRKLTARCGCGNKNVLQARFCGNCGRKLDHQGATRERGTTARGLIKLHSDIAHPVNAAARRELEKRVFAAFEAEKELAKQPGYVCRYDFVDEPDAPEEHGCAPSTSSS